MISTETGFVRRLLGCKTHRIMSNADLVIVGDAYLGRRAKRLMLVQSLKYRPWPT
jgi:hypothetical protein